MEERERHGCILSEVKRIGEGSLCNSAIATKRATVENESNENACLVDGKVGHFMAAKNSFKIIFPVEQYNMINMGGTLPADTCLSSGMPCLNLAG